MATWVGSAEARIPPEAASVEGERAKAKLI